MDDFISRQAAINIVCDGECEDCPDGGCDMYRRLKRLPAMTNADRIRSMTDEELKEFVCNVCRNGCLALLKQEVSDGSPKD